ncbi:MAG: ketoacyl-ACP synthase III [Alphaproteobacteria bacterium]|nr:ketoacyl-ACP synthase III [Alphaproteobacteria bacterium]
MKCIRSEIVGYGHYLPKKVLTNDDLSKMVETNDEWISTRTGIKSRHIAEDLTTAEMSVEAAKNALVYAGLTVDDVDLIVVGTLSGDNTTPSCAAKVGKLLGARFGVPTFDVAAACSGFVYALTMADNMIKLGQIKTALVIGAERLSKVTDWTDRNTCVLFGDGAGAIVLKAREGDGTISDTGVLSTRLYSDCSGYDYLYTTGGVSTTANAGYIFMNGKEVFKSAVGCLSESAIAVMSDYNITSAEIDFLVPHQANIRIIENVGHKLDLPTEKVIVTVDHHGNTSAASIPLALSESVLSGKIKRGDLIVLTAMGAGFTWGGALIRI